ncbi:hypothetical protein FJZ19_06210, partial [Candidatus Pacearchaeota archaeon]|nr:hypothetical protein [Candidatus Pacearchaeota archaeon]
MGKIKYLADIRKLFKESPVVDLDSLKKFLNKKDKRYVWLIVNNLLKKGEIKKLAKGYYTIHEDNSLAVFCFKPSYLGLQNALTFHHLWDQATIPVIITPRKIRQGLRVI